MKSSKKTILLSSLTTLSIASGIAAIAIANSNQNNITNVFNSQKSSRSTSNNEAQPDKLMNPDEVFFSTESFLAPTVNDLMKQENGKWVINEENVQKWKTISENFKNLPGNSASKDKLAKIGEQVEKSAHLNVDLKTIDQYAEANQNSIIAQLKEQIKQLMIEQSGAKENPADILGGQADWTEEINKVLLSLSGITEGNKISSILPKELKKYDVSKQGGNIQNLSINSIAGEGYNQLIKIAEIETSQTGNYALQFNYNDSSIIGSRAMTGTLYIKNDDNQLSNAKSNIKSLVDNLDVFIRFNTISSSGRPIEIGTGSAKKIMENFVLQFKDDKLEVLIRTKTTDRLNNIEFVPEGVIQGATNIQTPLKFGILDVQATDDSTFRSIISKQNSVKLVDNIADETKVISKIQSFSATLKATKPKTKDAVANWENDREMIFYQGKSDVQFKLNYASKEGANEGTYKYIPLVKFDGSGLPTSEVISLNILNDGTQSSTFPENSNYEFHQSLLEKLPIEAFGGVDNFEKASTIKLISKFDNTKKISEQKLKFTDYFYAIGEIKDKNEWGFQQVNEDWFGINILDPTQKIFAEKPENFDDSATSSESEFKAQVQVDELTVIKNMISEVYKNFSNGSLSDYDKEYSLGVLKYWESSNEKDIKISSKEIKGDGKKIYDELNGYWARLSKIISDLFKDNSDGNRYKASSIGQATNVVNNFLASIIWQYNNVTEVKNILNETISKVKEFIGGSIQGSTTYESLSDAGKKYLGQQTKELIRLQFNAINEEFTYKQYKPIVSQLEAALNDKESSNYAKATKASEILEVRDINGIKAIKYKSKGWENITEDSKITFAEATKSLFDLLYFSNENETYLGSSLFNATDTRIIFESLSSSSLVGDFSVNPNSDSIKNKILIYDSVITYFIGSNFSIQSKLNDMLSSGKPLGDLNIKNNIKQVLSKLSSTRKTTDKEDKDVTSNVLDDVISGTNAIIALKWKLNNLSSNTRSVKDSELDKKINAILNTAAQAGADQLSIWSNIIKNDYNFSEYSELLSGRGSDSNFDSIINALVDEKNIKAYRINTVTKAVQQLEEVLKYLWWIIVALVAVGVLTSSIVGISTKNRQVKLSSRPVLKWLLISGIVFGLAVAAVAIIFGLLPML